MSREMVERLTPEELARIDDRRRNPDAWEAAEREADRERIESGRVWGAVMLARSLDICRSVLRGQRVEARFLDAEALRRMLRGNSLPSASEFLLVTAEMLDAVAEAGPFEAKEAKRR